MTLPKGAGAGCPDTAPATADAERINPAPADPPRHTRALAWRKSLDLGRVELAALTGFSVSVIRDFEAGSRRGQKPEHAAIDEASWRRYGLACAALDAGLKPLF